MQDATTLAKQPLVSIQYRKYGINLTVSSYYSWERKDLQGGPTEEERQKFKYAQLADTEIGH